MVRPLGERERKGGRVDREGEGPVMMGNREAEGLGRGGMME